MSLTKAWDWSKNESGEWLQPCVESAYLAQRWRGRDFTCFFDLGCGLGRHSVYMAQNGFAVWAADLSDYGVEHTRAWAARENAAVEAVLCDMLALPYETDAFDCAMAYNVIYHTDTKGVAAALAELARVLRPGGELFLTLLSKNTWGFRHREGLARVDDSTVLRDEHDTERNVPHFYAGPEDLRALFAGWRFVLPPAEHCVYNLDDPQYYSTHWQLLLENAKRP